MVTGVDVATGLVVTGKVALMAPAGTVTLAETVAAAVLLLERVTRAPPLGAGPFSVTVPLGEDVPPVTLAELRVNKEGIGGITVSEAVWVTPLKDAEMVTRVDVATGLVVTGKVALMAPAGTDTLPGTVAAALPLERATRA